MGRVRRQGAEDARNGLPDLLDAAEKGKPTIITRHGRPVAALVPIDQFVPERQQHSILSLRGSGRGLWGKDSSRTIDELRDEWNRSI